MYSGHSQFSFIWYTSIFDPSRESKSLLRELYCQYVLSHSLPLVHSGEFGNNLVEFHKIVQCPQKLLLGTWRGSTLYRRLIWTTWVPFQHGDFPSQSKRCVNVISFLSLFLHLLVISCSYAASTYVTSSIMPYMFTLCRYLEWDLSSLYHIFVLFVSGKENDFCISVVGEDWLWQQRLQFWKLLGATLLLQGGAGWAVKRQEGPGEVPWATVSNCAFLSFLSQENPAYWFTFPKQGERWQYGWILCIYLLNTT